MDTSQSASQLSIAVKPAPVDVLKQQRLQDELNRKRFNEAQRNYIKCTRGKCPAADSQRLRRQARLQSRPKKKKNFISARRHDRILSRLFIEKGRKKRIEILEAAVAELSLRLRVAGGKLHLNEINENYRQIERHLRAQTEMKEQVSKAKMEIEHLKSQIERLDRKSRELDQKTESESQFAEHFKRANHQLEVYERKVEISRQKECKMTAENRRLRELLQDMIIARDQFNRHWSKGVTNLRNRKKFLLDMIERSSQAFAQREEHMDDYQKISARRRQGKVTAIAEMLKMKRQIDANDIMSMFLGSKGQQRKLAPLQACEIGRRYNVKVAYTDAINLYRGIIDEARKATEIADDAPMKLAIDSLTRFSDESFQLYNYINYQLSSEVEDRKDDVAVDIREVDKARRAQEYFETKLRNMEKKLGDCIQDQFNTRREIERMEAQIDSQCRALKEIIEESGCDMTPLADKLGDHSTMNGRNFMNFLALFEKHVNKLIAFAYCKERDEKRLDILATNERLVVKSLKREDIPLVKAEEVITIQHCPECAEIEDFNRYDDTIVSMLQPAEIYETVMRRAGNPKMKNRMHTLSACKLPQSCVVASRRYAE